MDTSNIKRYAPKAREQFRKATMERLAHLGIDKQGFASTEVKGDTLYIDDKPYRGDYADNLPLFLSRREAMIAQCMEGENFSAEKYDQYVDQIAYTWFNRFCALRYMELHGYLATPYRLLSNPDENSSHAIEALMPANILIAAEALGINNISRIQRLLLDNELERVYQELLLAACDQLHQTLPFMFQPATIEEALLLPANLTGTGSILQDLVTDIPEADWQNIEIIGWLYQYYISEKKVEIDKDKVSLKKEDIPYATQLFTPNWIVKYLVQNSVGHYWLQTNPHSDLQKKMEFYIAPADQEASVTTELEKITPDYIDPETITVLDPACGSGHILLEAYNVLKEIYRESGYLPHQIPRLILEKNLYGLDIDDRATQLAAFAVTMIAVKDDQSLLKTPASLNIISFKESRGLNIDYIWQNLLLEDPDNQYQPIIRKLFMLFKDAKTLGSLIKIDADQQTLLAQLFVEITAIAQSGDHFQKESAVILLPFIQQALLLSQRYDAIIANPPYLGTKAMNSVIKEYLSDYYSNSKSDLFAAFIEQGFYLAKLERYNSMVTMQSWMFLSSYEKMRKKVLIEKTILTMAHLDNNVMQIAFGTNATVFLNVHIDNYKGSFSYVEYKDINDEGYPKEFPVRNNRLKETVSDNFKKIPSSPIAYWVTPNLLEVFQTAPVIDQLLDVRQGLATANNDRFLRLWYEVESDRCKLDAKSAKDLIESDKKWVPYNKGGQKRQWYGNYDYLINWENDGYEIKNFFDANGKRRSVIRNPEYHFKESITWGLITSGGFSIRYRQSGGIHDVAGMSAFCTGKIELFYVLALLVTPIANYVFKLLNPTLNLQVGDFKNFPVIEVSEDKKEQVIATAHCCVDLSKQDWDAYETSWDFTQLPLIALDASTSLAERYAMLRENEKARIAEVQRLETENNRLFIEAYGLEAELSPEVPLEEITLTCNPAYRYGGAMSEAEKEKRYQSDTITELLSYIIGCAMGRYSLDREGLVYAHAGNEGFQELVDEGAYTTFPADKDGIIPLTSREEGWFTDDATQRVIDFVKEVWGEEQFEQNLQFIADSLNLYNLKPRKGESALQTIDRYFATRFYKDHCTTYQKTPIYWLVSSGKERAFEALFYLHRYNSSTLSKMRIDYVVPLLGKFHTRLESLRQNAENASSTAEKRRLENEIKSLEKRQIELVKFDENIRSMADAQIALDLDDGVKVNYGKFDTILAKIP